uniref:Acyl_transf_3 domain-containing protein n=1 Tax=Panagrellus redivivus TaxID=6233 RepID=A0A7E4UXM0_PANRE
MKYGELQGLRGLAILAVVLYHLWPKVFWNGFLGVDMFFVLSGFLMAETNLKKLTSGFSFTNGINFWYRRIRRIVPLSILVVFATWILVTKKLAIIDYNEITKEAYCAMSFLTNLCAVKETKYYFHENDFQYFKHYWSLAVEIQFYAVVPLFFAVFTRMSTKATLFIMLPILITASLVTQTTLFIAHYPEAGFSLLFSRLWQFGAGIAAFYVRKFGDEIVDDVFLQRYFGGFFKILHNHYVTDVVTVVTALIVLYPKEFEVSYMMIVVTLLAAVAITSVGKEDKVIGEKSKTVQSASGSWVLSVWALRKLGDASFAIYVTHWMVQHCFWVMAVDFDWLNTRLVCFYTIMIIGFGVHHGIEKPLLALRHSKRSFFKTLIAAYVVVAITIYTTKDVDPLTNEFIEKFYHEAAPLVNNKTAWTALATQLNFEKAARLAIYTGHTHCGFYTRSEWSQTRDSSKATDSTRSKKPSITTNLMLFSLSSNTKMMSSNYP